MPRSESANIDYQMSVGIKDKGHSGRATVMVLSGSRLVTIQRIGFPIDQNDSVDIKGVVAAFQTLVEHVHPLPDSLTLYTSKRVEIEDVLPHFSAQTRESLADTELQGGARTSSKFQSLFNAIAMMMTPNAHTRFHENPWLYEEPVKFLTDASLTYDNDGNPATASVGWYAVDDRNAIIAMSAHQVDESDPNDAEEVAVEEAITFACDIDTHHIQVLTDSEAVARRIDHARTNSSVEKRDLLTGFERADVVLISRGQNQVADALSDLARQVEFAGKADAVPNRILTAVPRCLGRTLDGSRCQNRVEHPGQKCHLHPQYRGYY